jgi:dihydrofolate reductase
MRKIILGVAVSLDGYIEGPNGEYDWCFTDQDYGLQSFFEKVDTVIYGRKSYEELQKMGGAPPEWPTFKEYVFSRTLSPGKLPPEIVLISGDTREAIDRIRQEPGKDIWLFGGASLTASLMELGLVDILWLSVHPILLGTGKPLFPPHEGRRPLKLLDSTTYSTGLVSLTYEFA